MASEGSPLVDDESRHPVAGWTSRAYWSWPRIYAGCAGAGYFGSILLKVQVTKQLFVDTDVFASAFTFWNALTTAVALLPITLVSELQLPSFLTRILCLPEGWRMPKTWALPQRNMAMPLVVVFICTAINLGLSNVALDNLSVPVHQCIMATSPVWTTIIEHIAIDRMPRHVLVYLCIAIITLAAILVSIGDEADENMRATGIAAAAGAVLASALKCACHPTEPASTARHWRLVCAVSHAHATVGALERGRSTRRARGGGGGGGAAEIREAARCPFAHPIRRLAESIALTTAARTLVCVVWNVHRTEG